MVEKTHKRVDIPPKPDWWDSALPSDQTVTVNWDNQNSGWWNETCADIIEVFGLPGSRYYYHARPEYMTFTFKSQKDALLCRVLISDKNYQDGCENLNNSVY